MKLQFAFLICCVHLSRSSIISEDFGNSFDFLNRQRKHVQGHWDAPDLCKVSEFDGVTDLDLGKLDGDWFEVFRTETSVLFRSGLWRIQYTKTSDSQNFLFTARFMNKKCMDPVHGTIIPSPNNPSSFVMKYRGLKGDIEEEYKVIQTDYRTRLVLYACHKLRSNGQCVADANVLIVLSKHKSLAQHVRDNMREIAKNVCLETGSLIAQDSEDTCDMESIESHLDQLVGTDPICKRKSPCTIACPKCCQEQEDGCIQCQCGENDKEVKPRKAGCVYDLTECSSPKCSLAEKSEGCFVCNCPVVLKAPPVPMKAPPAGTALASAYRVEIDDVRKCPTTCRIKTEDEKMICDCSNKLQCHPIPDNVPISCPEKDERWYFDDRTSTCHGFYGKCLDGRPNTFKSLKECINTCADVCELPLDVGTCSEQLTRFYFNRNRGECDQFFYTGCDGNLNNFETKAICKHKCPEWMDKPESNTRPEKCYQPSAKGHCEESHIRYFYLPVTRTCTSFFFSGCGENENNFKTVGECEQACIGVQAMPKQCPDVSECKCTPEKSDDDCFVCSCDEPDGAVVHSSSCLLLIVTTFLLLIRKW